MTDKQAESTELRAAVQHAVIKICSEEEEESGSSLTGPAIKALTELTFLYATSSLANDLDAFSTHAGRRTINADDVKLVARKNPEVARKLADFCQNLTKKARRKSSIGKPGVVLKENRGIANARESSCFEVARSDDSERDSDSEREAEFEDSKPSPKKVESSKKRARPTGSRRLAIDDSDTSTDNSETENAALKKKSSPRESAKKKASAAANSSSSTDDSDTEIELEVHQRKKPAIEALKVNDGSSTSSEESIATDENKTNSKLVSILKGSLSFSDDEFSS